MAAGAFLAALRGGDFDALLAVPGPDVVLVAGRTAVQAGAPKQVRGAAAMGGAFSGHAWPAQPAPGERSPQSPKPHPKCSTWACTAPKLIYVF